MNTNKDDSHGAVAGQVDCRVRPRAWMGVGCITGTPVFAMDDGPRSDACAPWLPLYELADANALVQQFVGEERDREADRWKWRVDGLTAQLREVDARYMALVKAVADGVALQPRPMMMLTPEFMQAQADEAPRLDLGA